MEAKNFFWSSGHKRKKLPIDGRLEEILNLIRENQVVVIEAETGAGKTTRIPQAILERWPEEKIILTQPRRPAVRWNGKRIAWEMGDKPGGIVGWKLFGEQPVVSKRTRCLVRIDQSVANQIRREGKLPKGVLIIDEAHERHISTDALLIMVRELLPSSPETRVVITSATIDTQKFSEYFDNAPVLKIEGRCYPVETNPYQLGNYEHHSQGAIHAAKQVLGKFAAGELMIRAGDGEDPDERVILEKGTVLVFLPGEEDIKNAVESLTSHARTIEGAEVKTFSGILPVTEEKEKKITIEVFSCFSKNTPAEQDRTQELLGKNTLRVICTTDIARGSVNFPDVLGSVDSLQIKRPFTDEKGVYHLKKIAVSRAEADQAKGRAGRTQPGFYTPVTFGSEYDNLKLWPTPAILREPLTSVVLQFVSAGINPRTCRYLDAPDPKKIDATITRLQKIGALTIDESITEIGELLLQFPIEPERAKSLILGDKLGVLAEVIIVTACLENEGIFFTPRWDAKVATRDPEIVTRIIKEYNDEEYENCTLENLPPFIIYKNGEYELDCGNRDFPFRNGAKDLAEAEKKQFSQKSDFEAMVNAYRAFKAEEFRLRKMSFSEPENGSRRQREGELIGWCKRNFIYYKKALLVEHTISQLKEEIASSPLNLRNGIVATRKFDADALTKALASGMIDLVGKNESYNNYSCPSGDFQVEHQSTCPEGAPFVLIGGVRKVAVRGRKGRTNHILLADTAAPIEPAWLWKIMPQFCRQDFQNDHWYHEELEKVVVTEKHYFQEMKIDSRVCPVEDDRAVEVFAQALADGKVPEFEPFREENEAVREHSAWLQIRSGGAVAEIKKSQEADQYLLAFCDARAPIVSPETLFAAIRKGEIRTVNLKLKLTDWISRAEQAKILADNPDFVSIDGKEFPVEYSRKRSGSFEAKIQIKSDFAYKTSVETVLLPGGRQVELSCDYLDGKTFPEVRNKLEKNRIEREWQARRSENRCGYQVREEEKQETLLKLGSSVEVTKNLAGEPILGYFSFRLVKYSSGRTEYELQLLGDEAKAKEENDEALLDLLHKEEPVKEALTIPDEEIYKQKNYWDEWELSELGKALRTRMEGLVQTRAAANLLPAEIFMVAKTIKEEADAIKQEVAKKYGETKSRIEEAETELEVRTKVIRERDDREFVEAEIAEAQKEIQKAKEALQSLAYARVEKACVAAFEMTARLKTLAEKRSQLKKIAWDAYCEVSETLDAIRHSYDEYSLSNDEEQERAGEIKGKLDEDWEGKRYEKIPEIVQEAKSFIAEVKARTDLAKAEHRAKYSDTFWSAVGDDEACAEEAVAFADKAVEILGGYAQIALEVLEGEYTAPYGRQRRQDAVAEKIPGLKETEEGYYYFGKHRACDADAVLGGAVEYLRQGENPEPQNSEEIELARLRLEAQQREKKIEGAKEDVENGYSILLEFRAGTHPKTGGIQYEAGNKQLKYIANANAGEVLGHWYCREERDLVNFRGKKIVLVDPYLPVDPAAIYEEIRKLERKITGGEAESSATEALETEINDSVSEEWKDEGKRWWRHLPCDCTERVGKKATEVICPRCGASHTIK